MQHARVRILVYLFIISLTYGCAVQEKAPLEPVQVKPVIPETAPEPVQETGATPEMVEEYARINQISDLKTAEYYLTHPDYAKENPYTPTEDDIAFYEREFMEKMYPNFAKLAEKEGFMKARQMYMNNPPAGAGSRRIGTTRYNAIIQRLASGGGNAETGLIFEDDPAEAHYQEGMRLYKIDRLDEAIEEMEKAVKIKPDAPAILYNLGVMYKAKEDYAKAVYYLKTSLNHIKETGFTRVNLAMYSDAYMGALVNLGLIYSRIGMYEDAVEVLSEAVKFKPDDFDANFNLGNVYYLMGDMENANQQMRKSIDIDPDNAEAHNLVGLMYYRRGYYNAALDEFQVALKLEPGEKQYSHNLGLVLQELGRLEEANKAFQDASGLEEGEETRRLFMEQTKENRVREMYNDGIEALQRLDYNKAIELFESVLKLKPDMMEAYFNLGVCYGQKGDTEKQIHHLKKAIELNPRMPDAHYNLGLAYSNARMYSEAASEFRKVIELKPSYAEARFQLGTVLYRMENYVDAAMEFEQCLVSNNQFESYLNLGSCYLKTDNVAGAIEQFEKAIALRPDSAEAYYSLGAAYMRIERYDEASRLFKRALEMDPSHRQARISLKELEIYRGS